MSIGEYVGFIFALLVSLVVVVPLSGVLVRFRANYNPKGLQLDQEGEAQPHTGPVVSSFVGMFLRVKRIEGWQGLFKGLMPTMVVSLILGGVMMVAFGVSDPRHGVYDVPDVGIFARLFYTIFKMLLALPTVVITYRAITTPHRLPWFAPIYSLRVLLTPTERRRPWLIYLTPGLLASQVAEIAYVILILHTIRRFLLPGMAKTGILSPADISITRLTVYFTIVILSTAILTPLEVISTRLAIQRNHAAPEFNSVVQEEDGDAETTAEYSGTEEDVIGLRSEGDPYLGLLDCGKSIVREEGWVALYRAWWLTMLGSMVGAFS